MVTASHNPAPDNGYKVYVRDGAQVIPPHDAEIAHRAASAIVPDDAALAGPFGDLLEDIDEAELLAAYRRAVLKVVDPDGPRRLRTVYSPLHGVGRRRVAGVAGRGGVRAAGPRGRAGHP